MSDKIKALAINGGAKVYDKPFPPWPQFNPSTAQKVVDILNSVLVSVIIESNLFNIHCYRDCAVI